MEANEKACAQLNESQLNSVHRRYISLVPIVQMTKFDVFTYIVPAG